MSVSKSHLLGLFFFFVFKNLSCDINLTFSQSQTLGSDTLFTFENNLALTIPLLYFLVLHT